MANKRMFSLKVVDTDLFLEMPLTSRLLYYELGMRADDDGFVDGWKKIMRMTGLSEDDMKVLIAKKFVIPFESGVIVIRHWRLNNYLQNDRRTETMYKDEMAQLQLENNVYELVSTEKTELLPAVCEMDTECIQNVYTDKNSIDKNSIDKNSIDKNSIDKNNNISPSTKHKYGEYKNVMLTDAELEKLKAKYENWEELIRYLDEYIEMKGYKAKSHYLAILKWVVEAVNEKKPKKPPTNKYQSTDDIDLDDGRFYANF